MKQQAVNLCPVFVGLRLPEPVREYQFAKPRKFAFDYCWPLYEVAMEIEGSIYGTGKPCPVCGLKRGGGHSSVTGILRDIEKYNLAATLGFIVVRVLPEWIDDGSAVAMVEQALVSRGWMKHG